jgi:hypothetical protein
VAGFRPTNFKNIFFPTDAFFPDCRSAAGMAFALVVRTCTEKDTVVQIVSNTGEGGVKYWIIQSFRHSLHLFCFTLSKQKNIKNILFTAQSFVIRQIIEVFCCHVSDKMAVGKKLCLQYYMM